MDVRGFKPGSAGSTDRAGETVLGFSERLSICGQFGISSQGVWRPLPAQEQVHKLPEMVGIDKSGKMLLRTQSREGGKLQNGKRNNNDRDAATKDLLNKFKHHGFVNSKGGSRHKVVQTRQLHLDMRHTRDKPATFSSLADYHGRDGINVLAHRGGGSMYGAGLHD